MGPGWHSLNLTNSSEDCLYANVYVPDGAKGPLPVMVWINAGEFRFGSTNDLESDWPYFANGSVVVVTANVRLGLFGYAALDGLRSRDPSGSTGNYGMQDQRAVLQWVKQSIASFGGDTNKITIFGESSGGSSVAFHMVSKKSKGLFHQAILESPGLTQSKPYTHAVVNTQYAASALTAAGSKGCTWPAETEWIDLTGVITKGYVLANVTKSEALQACASRPDCFLVANEDRSDISKLLGGGKPGMLIYTLTSLYNLTGKEGHNPGVETLMRVPNRDTEVQCLVNAATNDLVALNSNPPYDDTFRTDSCAPTVDGVELIAPLAELSRTAVPTDLPVLAGSNLDEGTEFMYLVPSIRCNASEKDFAEWAIKFYGAELGSKVPPVYQTVEEPTPLCHSTWHRPDPGPGTRSNFWVAAMRSAGDSAILCRARELLKAAQGKGKNSKVWWYYFTHTPNRSINMDDLRYEGAFHGSEVPFVWGDGFELTGNAERRLSESMGCYWRNFAATGDPNEGPSACAEKMALPKWSSLGQGDALQFDVGALKMRPLLKKEQCDTFAGVPPEPAETPLSPGEAIII